MTRSRIVLIVDDEAGIRRSLSAVLQDEGYQVLTAADGPQALTCIGQQTVDVVLLDIWMDGMDGIAVLRALKESHPAVPVVMMSGHGTIDTAVSALKLGAYDYLEKPLSLDRVTLTMGHALKEAHLAAENTRLRAQVQPRHEMMGDTPPIHQLRGEIERVAVSCPRVLIQGENGSGKELVARALHASSPRRDLPFVELNCAALPEHLIESELFGHEKGAFSGADTAKPGMFEQADTGALFLDEVGDMALSTQARVLRVLQEGTFQRLGDTKPRRVNVWVIAATHRDLRAEIAAGRFREDLFYRLNVVPLRVPPLRERRGDIALLIQHFTERAVAEQGLAAKRFPPEVVEVLTRHPWPGNVRELKNIVERLMILSPGTQITLDDLPDEVVRSRPGGSGQRYDGLSLREARDRFDANHIRNALDQCGGNISRAAERLRVERSNLSKKIRQLGIAPDAE